MTVEKRLTRELLSEMFQAERSAERHCRREALRLKAAPSRPLLATSAHAGDTLKKLEAIAERRGKKRARLGVALGQMFSEIRDKVADRLVSRELSYRGTLIGMRHCVDLFTLVAEAARLEEDVELAVFCEAWLVVRGPLVEEAAEQLRWFAANPALALEHAH